MPFWVNSVAAQSRQLDVFVLSLVAPGSATVSYAPAARLIAPLRLIPSTIAQASLPHMAGRDGETPRLWRLLVITLSISACVYVVVGLAAYPLVITLFGEAYAASVGVLQVLVAGLIFASASSVLTSYLQGTGREWRVAVISVVAAVISLLGIGVGGATFGAIGAALGLCTGYLVQFCLTLFTAARFRALDKAF